MLRPASLVRPPGVLLLQVGAVAQDDGGQIGGVASADDATAEPLADEPRQVAAMVEVSMGEHHRVQTGGRNREWGPVPTPQRGDALVEACVDQHPPSTSLDEEAAPGDRAGGTEEAEGRADGRTVSIHVVAPHPARPAWVTSTVRLTPPVAAEP